MPEHRGVDYPALLIGYRVDVVLANGTAFEGTVESVTPIGIHLREIVGTVYLIPWPSVRYLTLPEEDGGT